LLYKIKHLLILILIVLFYDSGISGEKLITNDFKPIIINDTKTDSTKMEFWFGRDKGLHFVGSMIGTVLLVNVNKHAFNVKQQTGNLVGAGIVLSIGITKETIDSSKKSNRFSWKDLAADVAGILIGLAIMEIK